MSTWDRLLLPFSGIVHRANQARHVLGWLPGYGMQRLARGRSRAQRPLHVVIALADHFEPAHQPAGGFAPLAEQERRLERWCRLYPEVMDGWRDADGFPFRHTYFYPAEQYDAGLIDRLAAHCAAGWGEVEVHLHHGVEAPDTSANTRAMLETFRDRLGEHGCLSRWNGVGPLRYAFVHGNWALANSNRGRWCGVDDEMAILSETGCFADFTLPSAPDPSQVRKINAIYECALPLDRAAPHRRGRDLEVGRAPATFPVIVQGPLTIDTRSRRLPRIENGAIQESFPTSAHRFRLWTDAAIGVRGRPDWVFVKLHCHGMDHRDESMMLGQRRKAFLSALTAFAQAEPGMHLYFATAREMFNMILAACDGREGSPGAFRNYRLQPVTPARGA
jgi:hypothetical protein